jgi:hypothetical protein
MKKYIAVGQKLLYNKESSRNFLINFSWGVGARDETFVAGWAAD